MLQWKRSAFVRPQNGETVLGNCGMTIGIRLCRYVEDDEMAGWVYVDGTKSHTHIMFNDHSEYPFEWASIPQ